MMECSIYEWKGKREKEKVNKVVVKYNIAVGWLVGARSEVPSPSKRLYFSVNNIHLQHIHSKNWGKTHSRL